MTTRVYKSTDSGAPVLTGQIDSLNNLLKAILRDGIGGAPASPWTVEFEDVSSHTCVFRPPAGARHYLQVQDNGPGPGSFIEAKMKGFAAMTGFNTGTDPFPSTTQSATAITLRKSATLDSTAHPWRAFVDEKTFYLFVDCGDSPGTWDGYGFGAYIDWNPAGAFGSMIFGRTIENNNSRSAFTTSFTLIAPNGTSPCKIFSPRNYTQTGTSQEYGVNYDSAAVNSSTSAAPGSFGQAYPYPVDSGVILMPARLTMGGLPVGRLRGLWIPGHNKPLVQDDIFNATEGALTRGFLAMNYYIGGQLFMETTATWDNE